MEIWKDVVGYEGLYRVSNEGRVKSLPRRVWGGKVFYTTKGKILKNCISNDGYFRINLSHKGVVKSRLVHQLVAESFLNHISSGHNSVIDHKNNIKTDNRVSNLHIVTHRFNVSKDVKNKTGYTGVYKSKNRFRVRIFVDGKRISLGMYKTKEEASQVYLNKLNEINDESIR